MRKFVACAELLSNLATSVVGASEKYLMHHSPKRICFKIFFRRHPSLLSIVAFENDFFLLKFALTVDYVVGGLRAGIINLGSDKQTC